MIADIILTYWKFKHRLTVVREHVLNICINYFAEIRIVEVKRKIICSASLMTCILVSHMTFTTDSRWLAVSTERGTTHLFAINPYGGKSHLT